MYAKYKTAVVNVNKRKIKQDVNGINDLQ